MDSHAPDGGVRCAGGCGRTIGPAAVLCIVCTALVATTTPLPLHAPTRIGEVTRVHPRPRIRS
jgi:hypothetical protein